MISCSYEIIKIDRMSDFLFITKNNSCLNMFEYYQYKTESSAYLIHHLKVETRRERFITKKEKNMNLINNSTLSSLNSFNYKPIGNASLLKLHKNYYIREARRQKTQFGDRIVLEIDDFSIYLPSRFAMMEESTITQLNTGIYCVRNMGPLGKSFNLEFSYKPFSHGCSPAEEFLNFYKPSEAPY